MISLTVLPLPVSSLVAFSFIRTPCLEPEATLKHAGSLACYLLLREGARCLTCPRVSPRGLSAEA